MGTSRNRGGLASQYDLNNDGNVTVNELKTTERAIDLENKDKKEDQQRRMAWVAMVSMLLVTVALFTPMVDAERVAALADLIGMFYIAMAGVVAAFFGSAAYMNVNR